MSTDLEDAARLEGFCDAESLVVAMLEAMCQAEGQSFLILSDRAANLPTQEKGPVEELAYRAQHRAAVLREAALAVSLGQHRTEQYDPDAVVAAHRAVVNRSQASAAGKGNLKRSEEARRESARNAANARWGKKEPK